jgi:hypothetical protein
MFLVLSWYFTNFISILKCFILFFCFCSHLVFSWCNNLNRIGIVGFKNIYKIGIELHFMLCSSYYWTCLKCVCMWILWTSKEQRRKTLKLGVSNIWFLVSICFHDAKVVVVVEKLFLQQRFYFCKVVVASMFLLCENSCCNCWIITFVTFGGLSTMWFEKQKLKFYCKASIVARLLLFWSFYYYFEVSIPLKLFIAIYQDLLINDELAMTTMCNNNIGLWCPLQQQQHDPTKGEEKSCNTTWWRCKAKKSWNAMLSQYSREKYAIMNNLPLCYYKLFFMW